MTSRVVRVAAVAAAGAAALSASAAGAYVGLVTGRLTLDVGVGRRTRPLGPIVVDIAAPRETVYAEAAAPYAVRRTRAMQKKVEILDRDQHMLLAAHHTPVGLRMAATTVEAVTLDPPERIGFRLVRGPVPYVAETFTVETINTGTSDGTRLTYSGELGTDLWGVGAAWGNLVAHKWVDTVRASLDAIKAESERRTHRR